ncbi:hypothetical protein OFO01_00955 [Campylobacter sp. JMF_01 NE2]|uniref:hypothetical protein n=1 Tax=unclassified Campylobacter TaxID=2593542 RepID=UPI0022E9C554|nr:MULTISPECIES: hypothetical protein [unclassified Campylobacter]MDA3043941.1 hypothetical protein [Campylobacter sp. JMF_09 ED2]MDA3045478.1 hypothetical protein [Campylobacter sp. JMF_07 ED4]MDA3045985.1 hypothetical protein [Campylobacter sp. VBCF_06 NA8]MDA3048667.1 hypothetical protein [Campylobacter sp. JMF_08 NE1]MDA3049541.1 hypothetical protein [Campylobacter sp. JMF_15 NE4]
MNKADTIKAVERFVNSQEMMMFRVKKGIYQDSAQNLEQVFAPFKDFYSFLKNPANKLQELLGNVAYDSIVSFTESSIEHCDKIWGTYFVETKGLFKSGIKYVEPDFVAKEKAKAYYDDLVKNNEKLMEYIDIGLQRLHSLEDKLFL